MSPEDRWALERLRLRQRSAKAKVEIAAVGTVLALCTACVAVSLYILG
jgi:hypothetical protein